MYPKKINWLSHTLKSSSHVEISKFSVTQILREIKIGESRVTKSAILTYSEALNFHFFIFCTFWSQKSTKLRKFSPSNGEKRQFYNFSFFQNWFHAKFWNFHTVHYCIFAPLFILTYMVALISRNFQLQFSRIDFKLEFSALCCSDDEVVWCTKQLFRSELCSQF